MIQKKKKKREYPGNLPCIYTKWDPKDRFRNGLQKHLRKLYSKTMIASGTKSWMTCQSFHCICSFTMSNGICL